MTQGWRHWVEWGLLWSAFGAACFALGHWAAPTRTVYRDRVVERAAQAQATAERQAVELARAGATERERVEETVRAPDGTTTARTRTIYRDRVEYRTQVERQAAQVQVEYRDRVVERTKTVEKAPGRPAWRLSALGGADLPALARGRLAPPPWAYGGHLERRLWGPAWVGVWGLSTGAGGVSVSWEW